MNTERKRIRRSESSIAAGGHVRTPTPQPPARRTPAAGVREDLEQQLADVRNRIQELTTGHRKSLEEFEKVKLRIRREVARDVERGRRAMLAEMLDVLDNLDRAIAASRDQGGLTTSPTLDQLVRGVELVRDQFLVKLDSFGVSRVATMDSHSMPSATKR